MPCLFRCWLSLALIACAWPVPVASAAGAAEAAASDAAQLRAASVARGIAFLRAAQAADGSFSAHAGPGPTPVAAAALLKNGCGPADPTVARALKYVEGQVKPDGGVYQENSLYRNYETCLAIMCFEAANADGRYQALLDRAERYLREIQWNEGEGHETTSDSYGGAGYGNHKRPDLSNTAFLVEALQSLGNGPEDDSIQQALVFVSRCQNLESEHNQSKFPALNPDGGFYYTIAAGGSSQAGETPNGGLRSYGSMTYAGLKSMIYAGVEREDPRVQAAWQWIQAHYTLAENPGMGTAGYYYYLHTFAKALAAIGDEHVVDDQQVRHDWRSELTTALADRQQDNGSWLNDNSRWLEGDPHLVTSYALLALAYCQP
jgi:squalene-hopene/tetraprenyl-beta-curcumene cyclase